MKAILTYDLGTTGLKTALFDPADGRLLALAEQEFPTHRPRPGWAEQDPGDWWQAMVATTRAVLAAAPAAVAAIGLSTQRETLLLCTAEGEPLGPAVLWQDRRNLAQAQELAAHFGDELHQVTGLVAEPGFTAAKLLWFKEQAPGLYRRARWFLQPKDFLALRLTGAPFLDPSLASRSLLYDVRRQQWWPAMLERLELSPERLPPVVASDRAGGVLGRAAAGALGLPPGIPVAAGGGDRACEALGVAAGAGRVMASTGTATSVAAVAERLEDRLPPGILTTVHVLPGRWLLEQGISTTGAILRWLRDTLTGLSYAELDALAAASPPGAGGLLLLPFFQGARATRWHPQARGALLGLTLGHSRGDLARAVMEGVAMEVRACLELLHREGVAATELVALGGGALSPLWRQIQADVAGCPVRTLRLAHGASVGAMVLGAAAAGLVSDPLQAARALNPAAAEAAPRPAQQAFYQQWYGLYNEFYRAVAGLYPRLEQLAADAPT